MDPTLIGKLIGLSGLVLDIVGAYCLYRYAFTAPPRLLEQRSLPGEQEEEMVGGIQTTTIILGAEVNLNAVRTNWYHEYVSLLCRRRISFGFGSLIAGFALQALGSFTVGYVAPLLALATMGVVLIIVAAVFTYLFAYLRDLSPPPAEGDFRLWNNALLQQRRRAGLLHR